MDGACANSYFGDGDEVVAGVMDNLVWKGGWRGGWHALVVLYV